jgi:hypothetical protein
VSLGLRFGQLARALDLEVRRHALQLLGQRLVRCHGLGGGALLCAYLSPQRLAFLLRLLQLSQRHALGALQLERQLVPGCQLSLDAEGTALLPEHELLVAEPAVKLKDATGQGAAQGDQHPRRALLVALQVLTQGLRLRL